MYGWDLKLHNLNRRITLLVYVLQPISLYNSTKNRMFYCRWRRWHNSWRRSTILCRVYIITVSWAKRCMTINTPLAVWRSVMTSSLSVIRSGVFGSAVCSFSQSTIDSVFDTSPYLMQDPQNPNAFWQSTTPTFTNRPGRVRAHFFTIY